MTDRRRWILVAAVLGSGIVFLDSTVVNVALPRIGQDLPRLWFGVLEGQSYVYNAYLLTLSALLILAGALSDVFGRRRMFLWGLVGFGVTSVLCGLAPNMELLVLFRVLQGVAGAILVPGSLALLTANFEGEAQGRAFGLWAGASGATTILGPFIGGLLVDTVSWRAAFLINVPLIIVALWATYVHVPESRDETASRHFDWIGSAIVALAVGGLAFGTIYGQQRDWQDPLGYVALAVGVLCTIALPFYMARVPHPLIPLSLFRSRNFTVTNVSTLLIYGALYVTFYYLTLFVQGTIGYTAAAAGLAPPGGAGVRHQQCDLARRPTARGRADLRLHHRQFLQLYRRAADRYQRQRSRLPQTREPAQPLRHPDHGKPRARCIDHGLSPGDDGGGRSPHRRSHRQCGRYPGPSEGGGS